MAEVVDAKRFPHYCGRPNCVNEEIPQLDLLWSDVFGAFIPTPMRRGAQSI
jgi:hypothetical protein